jgi:hypothetical protein
VQPAAKARSRIVVRESERISDQVIGASSTHAERPARDSLTVRN